MIDAVRCKFSCHKHEGEASLEPERTAKIQFGAVWEGTTENQAMSENAMFGKSSPNGSIFLGIANPVAANFFKEGKKYYVTFTEAPD
jgi:hypothetical protein